VSSASRPPLSSGAGQDNAAARVLALLTEHKWASAMAYSGRVARDAPARRGQLAFGLTALAFVWAVALIAGAFVVPLYSGEEGGTSLGRSFGPVNTSSTLIAQNGLWVLVPVAVPAVMSLLVWIALRRKCMTNSRAASVAASAGTGVLAVFNTIAMFSIGVFVLPVTVLLIWAVAITPGSRLPYCRGLLSRRAPDPGQPASPYSDDAVARARMR
jgi:hypothetical protein